jgi:hypothetical protein
MTPMYLSGSITLAFNSERAPQWRWRFTRIINGVVGIIPFGRLTITLDGFKVTR